MYSEEKIEKIGNTVIYLTTHIPRISKTKLLKLLYILDEISIKKGGLPFLNLEYKVWKFGPVSDDMFVEFSESPSILKGFIKRDYASNGYSFISPLKGFNDDEFSQNELDLLAFVVKEFKDASSDDLVSFTHRKKSPWHNAASRNSVLDILEQEKISKTDIVIDMKELIQHDQRKLNIYSDFLENS